MTRFGRTERFMRDFEEHRQESPNDHHPHNSVSIFVITLSDPKSLVTTGLLIAGYADCRFQTAESKSIPNESTDALVSSQKGHSSSSIHLIVLWWKMETAQILMNCRFQRKWVVGLWLEIVRNFVWSLKAMTASTPNSSRNSLDWLTVSEILVTEIPWTISTWRFFVHGRLTSDWYDRGGTEALLHLPLCSGPQELRYGFQWRVLRVHISQALLSDSLILLWPSRDLDCFLRQGLSTSHSVETTIPSSFIQYWLYRI